MAFPYEDPNDPAAVDIDPARLAAVVQRFRQQQASGAFPGGQLVLRRHGRLVLNIAAGVARGFRADDPETLMAVEAGTPFSALSAGKPLAALAIALLEDRGLLDIQEPIARVWPEFSRHGKDHITTLDVLTHRSGVLMPEFVRKPHLWGSREAVQSAMVETRPTYPRGTLAYHPHEFGWILSEVVHRITGQALADLFEAEFALPMGLRNLGYGLGNRPAGSLAYAYWLGPAEVTVAGVNVAADFEAQNSPAFFAARNPATGLVCDAASLAACYDWILGGAVPTSSPVTIDRRLLRLYTSRQAFGWDRSLRMTMAVGRGFVVGTLWPSSFGWWNTSGCFGHAGGFSSLAFGDYRKKIAVAILTNGNRSMTDFTRRFLPLADGLRKACLP